MIKIRRKINFYDCDPAGILFYARIFDLCHSAYEELIASFGIYDDYWGTGDYVVPIIHSEATYQKPIKFGDQIIIELNVSELKSTSFILEYNCVNEAGELCCKVKTIHVFVDKNAWQKTQLTTVLKEGLEKHLIS